MSELKKKKFYVKKCCGFKTQLIEEKCLELNNELTFRSMNNESIVQMKYCFNCGKEIEIIDLNRYDEAII